MNKNLSINIYSIAILCLLSYFELGAVRSLIYPNKVILFFSLAIGILIFISKNKLLKITRYELFCFAVIILCTVFRNRYLEIKEFDINIIYYLVLLLLIICMHSNSKWIKSFINFMYCISLMHALATIIFAFFPNLFYLYTSKFLSYDLYVEAVTRYHSGTISGLCVNYGQNAGIIAIGTGIAILKILFPSDNKITKKTWVSLLILILGLIFTGKRSPILLMIIAIAIIYVFIENKKQNKKIIVTSLILIFVSLLVYYSSSYIPQFNVLISRLMNLEDWNSLGGRKELYAIAIEMWKKKPFFGNGWNSYKLVTENSIGRLYASQYSRMQTHNIYLQLLSEVGIFGLLGFITIFFWPLVVVFYKARKHGLKNLIGKGNVSELVSVMFILLFFMLYGLTGNPLYDGYMYFLAFMCCGALQYYYISFMNKMEVR